ncbi:MAG: NAD(+) kinase [Pseudomonadales bacterium]
MDSFRHIGLMGRVSEEKVRETISLLERFLLAKGVQVVLEERVAAAIPDAESRASTIKMIGESCDLAIIVGGDGSLIGAARQLAQHDIPLLGVNRGRLGFLTDVSPDQLETQIGAILEGEFKLEKRFLLEALLTRDGQPIGKSEAVNDVVLDSGKSARMIEYELFIDDEFVYSQQSDGLIISSPTGSTAYALSGGGPIMHPKLDALVLVPMFPHTLSSRPIVVDGNSEIKIVIGGNNPTNPQLNCDGQVNFSAAPGDVLYVRKRRHSFKLVHPLDHSFYAACRDKLDWGNRLGRRSEPSS